MVVVADIESHLSFTRIHSSKLLEDVSSPIKNVVGRWLFTKIYIHVRASPRVCQILLGKFCVMPSSKKICQVKKVHLQQFGIIHLSNPDLTYIRDSERKQNYVYVLPLLETYIRNPHLFFISFFTLPPREKRPMATTIRARIYARGDVSFVKFLFLPSWFTKLS
jgi:hypothetical protein